MVFKGIPDLMQQGRTGYNTLKTGEYFFLSTSPRESFSLSSSWSTWIHCLYTVKERLTACAITVTTARQLAAQLPSSDGNWEHTRSLPELMKPWP